MDQWRNGPNVVITGTTTGIGYELSKLFAQYGFNLVLVARNSERLQQHKEELEKSFPVQVKTFELDLSDPVSGKKLFESLKKEDIYIKILVNNAGFGLVGPFVETDLEKEIQMIQLNGIAPVILSKLFLRQLPPGVPGRILNVASTAAFIPGPLMAVYYASKAQLLSFGEALGCELAGKGVTVTSLCPGPTATEFQRRAGQHGLRLLKTPVMDAYTVAWKGFAGLMRGKRIVVPGILNKLAVLSMKLFPQRLLLPVVKYLHR
jgi:short-subunit dehydrogenase